ncbi:MAG: Asp/Glu racemase [Mesorhizobium sp.]|uniref:maleate cis-trans isomerase family protein n=1 Tax=Mesorhizobium sp. M1A.F.Ca.ET.072.01.1.1 TaxID=2496753 RepID=UPI000FD40CF7|nr:Asp/Glu racemase [Mesorhizobium sp. M1A.F.Ca.ET.072.01.1.1]RUW46674.1 Asp/Glu racemase [Mesorhizobium sp. M1A.F.Ca.ET.072.01.1.1]TIT71891.1 MAG: Asp/Glu racemase [Mesorhizobium sp.]TIU43742.1 MAG: Asp/Glu racemase [Mesorhizobium sp.]TIV02729.1 MAG: Asp/Glu racemase [Mesorhizobium sp.]
MSTTLIKHVEASLDAGMAGQIVIGLIALSTDVVTEYELRKMLPDDGVSISATRIETHNPITIENLQGHAHEIARAAELFVPREAVDVFAYGCTSGSALISQAKLEAELHRTAPGAKLTSPMTGAYKAFRNLGIARVSMLTPYPDEVTEAMIGCLRKGGISVVSCGSFHIENDYDIINVTPASIQAASQAINSSDAQAVFIPCTGLRTSSIIDYLEERLGKPVITAHQAMLWDALRLAGYTQPLTGLGTLFAT